MDHRRKFGFTVGGILSALAVVFILRHKHHIPYWVCVTVGPLLLLGALVAPAALGPVERVWMAGAKVLGYVNSRVLLSAVFFVLMAPVSFLLRLFGRDPLARRRDPKARTYWQAHTAADDLERYKRPY
jgi:hypothetical protein